MPLKTGQETPGAAGVDIATVEKPTGALIRIKKVMVMTSATMSFTSAFAFLESKEKTTIHIPLGRSVAQTPHYEGHIIECDQEWPLNYQLKIRFYAQAAARWDWFMEYEVIEEVEKPKRWGED